jgi:hypothetical protein
MASTRFRELERRLKKLRLRFLPKKFSPTGAYSERQLDHARGYRLLVHAEIESYLEERAQEIANSTVGLFKIDKRPRHVPMNLISFHLVQKQLSGEDLRAIFGRGAQYSDEALAAAQTAYNRSLVLNHGIKEHNILQILLPLGFECAKIDSGWLSTLDTFGTARGEVAHKSVKTHQLINPEDELNTTETLLKGLKTIDVELGKLRGL